MPASARLTDFNVIADKVADTDGFDMWILGRATAYGDAAGGKRLEYTVGPNADGTIYSIYGGQEAAVLALEKGD